jgi:hypothetical protein
MDVASGFVVNHSGNIGGNQNPWRKQETCHK